MSKKTPELSWQDKAILIAIPVVVVIIFIVSNLMSADPIVSSAFSQKTPKSVVLDGGTILEVLPTSQTASPTQKCRLKSRDEKIEYTFIYNVQGSQTMDLKPGNIIQFYGEYRYDPQGGVVEIPYKGKSGRRSGWAVYENKRYFAIDNLDEGL